MERHYVTTQSVVTRTVLVPTLCVGTNIINAAQSLILQYRKLKVQSSCSDATSFVAAKRSFAYPTMLISPSILSANFCILGQQLKELESSNCYSLHIDVMDGQFVPNITFGQPIIKIIANNTSIPLDIHLMIETPEKLLSDFFFETANYIMVHTETCRHLDRTLEFIACSGKKASVALNPSTPLNTIEWVLDKLSMALIMSVNPGFGGQSFIKSSLKKIETARKLLDKKNPSIVLGVDGGVNDKNIKDIFSAGANYVVAGAYVFSYKDGIAAAVDKLQRCCSEGL